MPTFTLTDLGNLSYAERSFTKDLFVFGAKASAFPEWEKLNFSLLDPSKKDTAFGATYWNRFPVRARFAFQFTPLEVDLIVKQTITAESLLAYKADRNACLLVKDFGVVRTKKHKQLVALNGRVLKKYASDSVMMKIRFPEGTTMGKQVFPSRLQLADFFFGLSFHEFPKMNCEVLEHTCEHGVDCVNPFHRKIVTVTRDTRKSTSRSYEHKAAKALTLFASMSDAERSTFMHELTVADESCWCLDKQAKTYANPLVTVKRAIHAAGLYTGENKVAIDSMIEAEKANKFEAYTEQKRKLSRE